MSLFATLMGKIFGHAAPAAAASPATNPAKPVGDVPPAPPSAPGTPAVTAQTVSTSAPPATSAPATASSPASVDVGTILDGLAAKNSEQLDWKKSIVDLMKLVGMDSSLTARKQLATELHYTGDMNDSASMNVWLHKAVLQKLAENGGKIPAGIL